MRILISAMVIALSVCSLASSRADAAGTYQLVPCHFQNITDQTYGKWSTVAGGEATPWAITARCPSEAEFRLTSDIGPDDTWAGFGFPENNSPANTIKTVNFDLLGSNGADGNLEQGVAICSPTTCSDPIRPTGSNVTTLQHHTLTTADFPAGANELRLIGRCLQETGCTPARSLKLKNLDIVFADTIAPSIEPSDIAITPEVPPLVPYVLDEQNVWHSWRVTPKIRWNVVGADLESGVQYVQYDFFRLDTFPPTPVGRYWNDYKFCGMAQQLKIGALCPKTLNDELRFQPQGAINNYGIMEGPNRVTAWAYDAAGNRSPGLSTEFLVDSIAPTLTVTSPAGAGIHWQAEPVAEIAWDNTGEVSETNRDSGLAGARWTLRDAETGVAQAGFAGEHAESTDRLEAIALPGDGVWKIDVTTFDRAGNTSAPGPAQSTTIGVDSTVLDAPRVESIAPQGSADVAAGVDVAWLPPANADTAPAGICGYALAADQNPSTDPGMSVVAAGDDLEASVNGEFSEGTNFMHVRSITCAGVGGEVAHVQFEVDKTAPELAISKPGPAGWYSDVYPLYASIVSGGGEGVSMALALDSATLVFSPVATLSAPLTEGAPTLTVVAKDAVGNSSTITSEVRIDAKPPRVEIAQFDASNPTRINVSASDSGSGVTGAGLQYRALGTSEWRAVAAEKQPLLGVAASFGFEESLPDLEMPDGDYELRAFARDNAGHKIEGESKIVRLPLRRAPSITAGFSQSRDFAIVGMGNRAVLRGRLNASLGEPLAGAGIEILESAIGRPTARVGTVTTDAAGGFEYSVRPGTSRRVFARYGGDSLHLPAMASTRFLVRPRVTLKILNRRLRGGNRVKFTGNVAAPGADWPVRGKSIRIVFRPQHGNGAVSIKGTALPSGRFSITHRFKRQQQALKFTVRAVVPWQDGWAYERGQSKQGSFVIR